MVRRVFPTLLLCALVPAVGCVSGGTVIDDDDAVDDDDAADDDDAGPFAEPAPLAELSEGACPDLTEPGAKTFQTGGMSRDLIVLFPEAAPEGMPVLFVWHGLGGSPEGMVQGLGLEAFAEDNEVIVIVPAASGRFVIAWDYANDATEDLAVFDDMRTCAVQELGADVTRVSSTGFSAGGVWTTSLSMRRADTLATILPMSGGLVLGLEYSTPSYPFPALLGSGAEGSDTWGAGQFLQDFAQTSDAFSEALRGDDHLVVRCDHGGGHTPSRHAVTMLEEWILSHRFGEPSPFADGDLRGLPDDECFWEDE